MLAIRSPGSYLGSFLSQHESVNTRAELIARNQLGKDVVLGGKTLGLRSRLCSGEQIECRVGRFGDGADTLAQHFAGGVDRDRPDCRALECARLMGSLDLSCARNHFIGEGD